MSFLLARRSSPAMQAALDAVAQAGREAGYALRQSPAVREQWRCLNLAGAYRSGGDFDRARQFVRMSREWRLGSANESERRVYPRTGFRLLGRILTEMNSGEEE